MTEEPYRWLDAIANRREYIQGQLKGGTPVLAASLPAGVLLLGVGSGHSKVFEVFDRHALAGLGHPADLERLRQAVIDAAHLEAFTRSPDDVSLRRLVSFGLAPQLKTAFEQIFAPPFLARLLLAEVGPRPAADLLVKVDFDGTFDLAAGGVRVVAEDRATEAPAEAWLGRQLEGLTEPRAALERLLDCWWDLRAGQPPGTAAGGAWREGLAGRQVEAAWLERGAPGATYRALGL